MRVDQLIKTLTTLAAQHGQDTPVYTYGDFDDLEISGVSFRDCWINADHPIDSEDESVAYETMPERIFLKV
jgi:hypothetical protein